MIRATAVQAFELDEVSNSRYNGSVTLSSALAIARHTSNRRPPAYALTQITEDWGSHDPALDGKVLSALSKARGDKDNPVHYDDVAD